jgi:tungstate transport system substrate-binding protein
VNSKRWPKVNKKGASEFIEWITSVETQGKIADFGKEEFGQSLFTPDSEQWKAKDSK